MGNKQSCSSSSFSWSPFIDLNGAKDITYDNILPLLTHAECITFSRLCKAHRALTYQWLDVYGPKCAVCRRYWVYSGMKKKIMKGPVKSCYYYNCKTKEIAQTPVGMLIHAQARHKSCIRAFNWNKERNYSAPMLLETKSIISLKNTPPVSQCANCGVKLEYEFDAEIPFMIHQLQHGYEATAPIEVKCFMTEDIEDGTELGFILCKSCVEAGGTATKTIETRWQDPLIIPMQLSQQARILQRFTETHLSLASALKILYCSTDETWRQRLKKIVSAHPNRFCIVREVDKTDVLFMNALT